jgi:putative ABC transport system permease protein
MSPLILIQTGAKNVLRQVGRTSAALTAVVFGVVSMILAAGFIDWNLEFGRDHSIESQLGHLQVMRPGFLELGRSDPHAFLLPARAATDLAELHTLPGYRVDAPRLLISGLAGSGDITLSFIGEGVDPAAEAILSAALRFPQGRNLVPGEDNTVIVGSGLAENLQAGLGDSLVLIANTETGGISAVEARVVGIFESIFKAYDDVALRIPLPLARALMRTDGEHLRLVLLDRIDQTETAVQQLRDTLPSDHYQVVPWQDMSDFYNKSVELFSKQVGVIYLIIGVIIVLAISNTMTMAVMERVGEIGTLMALGNRRRDILGIFLAEGCILGLLGAAVGLVLGVLLGLLISAIGIPMPPGPVMAWGYEAGIRLSPENLAKAAAIALATTVLASLYPAWKASRLGIVDALRTRQ